MKQSCFKRSFFVGTMSRTLRGDVTKKARYSSIFLGGSLCTWVWYFSYTAKEASRLCLNSVVEVQTVTSWRFHFYGFTGSNSKEKKKEKNKAELLKLVLK